MISWIVTWLAPLVAGKLLPRVGPDKAEAFVTSRLFSGAVAVLAAVVVFGSVSGVTYLAGRAHGYDKRALEGAAATGEANSRIATSNADSAAEIAAQDARNAEILREVLDDLERAQARERDLAEKLRARGDGDVRVVGVPVEPAVHIEWSPGRQIQFVKPWRQPAPMACAETRCAASCALPPGTIPKLNRIGK